MTANQLYAIESDDVSEAVERLRTNSAEHNFADSTRFDLLIDGYRRFPPKAVVGVAAQRSLGRILSNDEFSGGESSAAFRLLWNHGFEIATKQRVLQGLDFTFSVGRGTKTDFIIVESKGPNRNVDYMDGLQSLLQVLGEMGIHITDAFVDSSTTRSMELAHKRLHLRSHQYPVEVGQLLDVEALRHDITATAASTASSRIKGGGNPTKRLRLEIDVPGPIALYELAERLGESRAQVPERRREFEFQPCKPRGESQAGKRKGVAPTDVTQQHFRIQLALYDLLVEEYGEANVSAELVMACGRPADVVVRLAEGYEVYEIKSAEYAGDCIRQALGQLLEYSYWPGSPDVYRIWVIGPSPSDAATSRYLDRLRSDFSIPIEYRCIDAT